MINYYLRKFKNRIFVLPKFILNIFQEKYPRARYFVRNVLKIEIEKVLVGDIHGISSYDWYELTGDYSRLEEKITDSAYFELFDAIENGKLTKNSIKDYRYFKLGNLCIDKFGEYCGCKNEEELTNFLLGLKNHLTEYKKNKTSVGNLFVLVRQIKDSDLYEVIDGHHRVAMDAVLGRSSLHAYVIGEAFSGIQKKLLKVNMTNSKELYQPVEKATVERWPTIRNCQDRFGMIETFLKKAESKLENLKLIDIACSYGFFVKAFSGLEIKTKGLEIDKNSIEIGKISYGLSEKDYIQQPLQEYLKKTDDQFDIVCFFSILHHFGLKKDFGGGGVNLQELVKMVDKITKKYLFLDSGQNHEYWFKDTLSNWDDEFIVKLIMENSSFTSFEKLGTDNDNVGKYFGNYNRSLFVFKK